MAPTSAPVPFLVQVLDALAPLAVTLVSVLAGWVAVHLKAKFASETGSNIVDKVTKLASSVVLEIEQTGVAALRDAAADGKITALEAENAKDLALTKLRSHLGEKGKTEILSAFGFKDQAQLDAWLTSMLEAELVKAKALVGRKVTATIEERLGPESKS